MHAIFSAHQEAKNEEAQTAQASQADDFLEPQAYRDQSSQEGEANARVRKHVG